MNDSFFNEFDDETKLKLTIIRKYLREWISLFLGKQNPYWDKIFIADFFSGVGKDNAGEFGSPLIAIEEVANFVRTRSNVLNGVQIRFLFNDCDASVCEQLRENLKKEYEKRREFLTNVKYRVENMDFKDTFQKYFPHMERNNTAVFLLIDQFGFKNVTQDIIRKISRLSFTDVIFFISSNYVHRFAKENSKRKETITQYLPINPKEVSTVPASKIHRYVCNAFQRTLDDPKYYFAPFSIKRDSNINGVIFGTKNLRGLEKFLKVAWNLDENSGDANYNIEDDVCYGGQLSLFPEFSVPRKLTRFEDEMLDFIDASHPTNVQLYKFILTNGFTVPLASTILKRLQKDGIIEVRRGSAPLRNGSFFLSYEYFKNNDENAKFYRLKK